MQIFAAVWTSFAIHVVYYFQFDVKADICTNIDSNFTGMEIENVKYPLNITTYICWDHIDVFHETHSNLFAIYSVIYQVKDLQLSTFHKISLSSFACEKDFIFMSFFSVV